MTGWDWLWIGLLGLVFLYALPRAALYPMWAWDAVATWGCKARIFYSARGLDLTCIDAHNYYPNLLPLLLSYLYFALGRVNDSLVNVIFPLWGALLLGLLYSLVPAGPRPPVRPGPHRLSGTERHRLHRPPLYRLRRPAPGLLCPAGVGLHPPLAGRRRPPGQPDPGGLLSGRPWPGANTKARPWPPTLILAAALTLIWPRPAALGRARLTHLSVPLMEG